MTEPLTRPLFDNRLLKAAGGPSLQTSVGQGFRAATQTPMMTDLVGLQGRTGTVNLGEIISEEEKDALRDELRERQRQIAALESSLPYLGGQEKDEAVSRIEQLRARDDAIYSSAVERAIEEGRIQTPDALNEQYADLEMGFEYPMRQEDAQILADAKRADMIREAIMERTPGGVIPTVAMFGGGLVAMATDPLEVASTFIPFVGQAGKLRAIGALGRVGGRVAVGAVEGAAGAAITEPIYYGLSRSAQLDYTMQDALLNVGFGAIFGAGIGGVAGAFSRRSPGVDPRAPDVGSDHLKVFDRAVRDVRAMENSDVALRQFANDQGVEVFTPDFDALERQVMALEGAAADVPRNPLLAMVRDSGGVGLDSSIGRELRNYGFTPRNAPALFRRGARRSFDNIPVSEARDVIGAMADELADEAGVYLDPQKVADRISEDRRSGGAGAIQMQREAGEARRDLGLSRMVWDEAKDLGFEIKSQEELDQITRYVRAGGTVDDAVERLSIQSEQDAAADLAENASRDPLADMPASQRVAADVDFDVAEEIADLEGMVGQIEETEALALELEGIREMDQRAAAMDEIISAAAMCIARS